MRVRVGHEFRIKVEQPTPLICLVAPEAARHDDFTAPEQVTTVPHVDVHEYRDLFGNICRRMVAPAGEFVLRGDVTLNDDEMWDDVDFAAHSKSSRCGRPCGEFLLRVCVCAYACGHAVHEKTVHTAHGAHAHAVTHTQRGHVTRA